jgi:hypothetical protein
MQTNCEKLTESIRQLEKITAYFDMKYASFSVGELQDTRARSIQEMVEVRENVFPDYAKEFIEKMDNDRFWDYFEKLFYCNIDIMESSGFNRIESIIYPEQPKFGRFTEKCLYDLLAYFDANRDRLDQRVEHAAKELLGAPNTMRGHSGRLQQNHFMIYSVIISFFLDFYGQGQKLNLSINGLDSRYKRFFGIGWRRGKISLEMGADGVFENMSGGDASAKTAISAGMNMSGGRLEVGICGKDLGSRMSGGSLAVEEMTYSKHCFDSMSGGTGYIKGITQGGGLDLAMDATSGTIFLEEVSWLNNVCESARNTTVLLGSKPSYRKGDGNYYYFDQKHDQFERTDYSGCYAESGYDGSKFDSDLMKVSSDKLPRDWSGMTGGIMVLENIKRAHSIGRGLKGGIIIIDGANTTLEEAKDRVCKREEAEGGFIFYLQKKYKGKLFRELEKHEYIRLV